MIRFRAALLPFAVATAVLMSSERPAAWGFAAHRFIADKAIDLLPIEIRPYFQKHRAFIVEHAIDPDLWRTAGWVEEPPQHFLDMDAFGPAPFDALPHDRDQAIARFGRDMVQKNGLLPWRVDDMYGKLVKAFADVKADRGYARDNVQFLSAVMAHYIGDAHVPFHAVMNYDGQLTNQAGLHSRFEAETFERYRARLKITPVRITIAKTPREFVFDTLVVSASLVPPILEADRDAIGSRDVYDRAYYDTFFGRVRPTMERRLSEAIAATAAVITKAWEEGGKPAMVDTPRPERRRRPATPAPASAPPAQP
jgi:hypothetical protein